MDKRDLERVIVDQLEELDQKKRQKFIHRDAEDLIDFNSPQAQVVIGVRRCGKSTLCYNALIRHKINFGYLNLDDERLINLKAEDLNMVLEVIYKVYGNIDYLFIDEIQNIPEWYLFVNRLLRKGMHLVITGSNAKLLSGELATHLTGRHHTVTLYPFSFKEYCEFKEINTESRSTKSIGLLRELFDNYMLQGGFPELLFIRDKKDYINGLIDNIIKRDIISRFHIKHKSSFEKLTHHLLNIAPSILSESMLKDSFEVGSVHTIKNYISYIEQAYLLVPLLKFSYKSKLRISNSKEYPIDVSLMNHRENALSPMNLGSRLESIVYLELLRKYKSQGYDIFYFRDRSFECDFLVCNGNVVKWAIQVSYDITNPKTYKREIKGLVEVYKKTKAQNLLLLTDYEYRDVEIEGIKISVMPVYEYCLES